MRLGGLVLSTLSLLMTDCLSAQKNETMRTLAHAVTFTPTRAMMTQDIHG
jgi:hypothetical protein